MYETIGVLKFAGANQKVTDNLTIRNFVIEQNDGLYPNYMKFQLGNDRCTLIDKYKPSERIKVLFVITGKENKGEYYNNLNALSIERV